MKDIKDDFIPYEEALELKILGFDEGCIAYWRNNLDDFGPTLLSEFKLDHSRTDYYTQCTNITEISAPLYQQAFEFFREKHNMHGYIKQFRNRFEFIIHSSEFGKGTLGNINTPDYSTYEEAQLECLRTLIQLVKK